MGGSIPIHVAAAIAGTLGMLHLIYTLRDWAGEPRYFRPRDKPLLDAMRATKVALAPNGRDFWQALIGFHLSHSIGILLFVVLIELAIDPSLAWLRPGLVVVSLVYAVTSWLCWFATPTAGMTLATLLLAVGWLV